MQMWQINVFHTEYGVFFFFVQLFDLNAPLPRYQEQERIFNARSPYMKIHIAVQSTSCTTDKQEQTEYSDEKSDKR